MYCRFCGTELKDKAVVCSACGEAVDEQAAVSSHATRWSWLTMFVTLGIVLLLLIVAVISGL